MAGNSVADTDIMLNKLQCSVNITFISTGKPKNSCDSFYCVGLEPSPQYLRGMPVCPERVSRISPRHGASETQLTPRGPHFTLSTSRLKGCHLLVTQREEFLGVRSLADVVTSHCRDLPSSWLHVQM
ncbi:hypothetical protein L798_01081 [Zootermopsis nevadensis]|uniref:Uncharacterized protein n=1 Tax=Zootermopsis nevadensis TaxID=136037 RepID=A0A067RP23_ZOONE|nr:hypothetical protein L798_01081 [Zootermopsis nevadensis]